MPYVYKLCTMCCCFGKKVKVKFESGEMIYQMENQLLEKFKLGSEESDDQLRILDHIK